MQPSRRTRWQFSLTALFALTLVACTAAGIFGAVHRLIAAQERAFESITAKGGVVYLWENGTSIQFQGQGPWCGTGLNRVVGDYVSDPTFGNADLHLLDDVMRLNHIDFAGSMVTPTGVAKFRNKHPRCRIVQDEEAYDKFGFSVILQGAPDERRPC